MGSDASGQAGPVRVLIVDDEPDVLLLLQVQMAGRPEIELVGTAVDGEDGVDACRRLRPDAVVMDLLMPKLSGFEAIAVIRGEMPEVAIVAHSAVAGEHVRAQMEALDVPLVLKSGDAGALVAALLEATGRS